MVPVAITTPSFAWKVLSPTTTRSGPSKWARPRTNIPPLPSNLSTAT